MWHVLILTNIYTHLWCYFMAAQNSFSSFVYMRLRFSLQQAQSSTLTTKKIFTLRTGSGNLIWITFKIKYDSTLMETKIQIESSPLCHRNGSRAKVSTKEWIWHWNGSDVRFFFRTIFQLFTWEKRGLSECSAHYQMSNGKQHERKKT